MARPPAQRPKGFLVFAVVRRHTRIVIALVVGVVVLAVVRRLLTSGADPERPAASVAAPVEPPAGVEPAHPLPAADAPSPVTTGDDAWVPPSDAGTCPLTHPVKAKESSGIYHVEGGLSYGRTSADRCYASPDAAEADGYRAAKR